MINQVLQGDSLEVLKTLEDNSVDTVITDPPYGYSFMGKDWDKAVPSVEIWQECLRVLKPGAFACVMSAPRSDVQNAMISRLMEAGFRLDFTPIYWTYASGFPKAGNVAKLVEKRLGNKHESTYIPNDLNQVYGNKLGGGVTDTSFKPQSPQAKALDGSYAGFQPKPAVEVVIIAMKPLSEKTYVDQALKNGKGITWLDDCRVPTGETTKSEGHFRKGNVVGDERTSVAAGQFGDGAWVAGVDLSKGRFPANLLVSDDVLNDGVTRTAGKNKLEKGTGGIWKKGTNLPIGPEYGDSGSYSRYFDLDAWVRERLPAEQAMTFPFAIFPKASKSEKNKGLDGFELKQSAGGGGGIGDYKDDVNSASGKYGSEKAPSKNFHPTVKPLKLMSYLITLFSREGDTVLDPFVGSGTTVVAAKQLGRNGIGIEREAEYAEIARARVEHAKTEDDKEKATK